MGITVRDTLVLSISERIQLVSDIWDTIAVETAAISLTDSEKEVVDRRLQSYHSDPQAGDSWKDVRSRILNGL